MKRTLTFVMLLAMALTALLPGIGAARLATNHNRTTLTQ